MWTSKPLLRGLSHRLPTTLHQTTPQHHSFSTRLLVRDGFAPGSRRAGILVKRHVTPVTPSPFPLPFKSTTEPTIYPAIHTFQYFDTPDHVLSMLPLGPCWVRRVNGQHWEARYPIFLGNLTGGVAHGKNPALYITASMSPLVDKLVRFAFLLDSDAHTRQLDTENWGLVRTATVETNQSMYDADGDYRVVTNTFIDVDTKTELGREMFVGRVVEVELDEEGGVATPREELEKVELDIGRWVLEYPGVFKELGTATMRDERGFEFRTKYGRWDEGVWLCQPAGMWLYGLLKVSDSLAVTAE